MRALRVALGALLLACAPVVCAADELSVTVAFDEDANTVELKAGEAAYTLTDEVAVRVLKWFDGKRITVEGVVNGGAFSFRQVSEPKLDSSLTGVAFKDGILPKLQIGTESFAVSGPMLKAVVIGSQAGARSITFEGYVLRNADGSPDTVIVKRLQATTNVELFDKGRAAPGTTVWILGDAWWGLKAEVLGPGGTRDNTWWGDLTIGEPAEAPRATTPKKSLSEGLADDG